MRKIYKILIIKLKQKAAALPTARWHCVLSGGTAYCQAALRLPGSKFKIKFIFTI
jgi:hypothetical protein